MRPGNVAPMSPGPGGTKETSFLQSFGERTTLGLHLPPHGAAPARGTCHQTRDLAGSVGSPEGPEGVTKDSGVSLPQLPGHLLPRRTLPETLCPPARSHPSVTVYHPEGMTRDTDLGYDDSLVPFRIYRGL